VNAVDFLVALGLAFVPLLVAVDPAGCVPIFLGLTADLDRAQVRRIVNQAAVVSFIIAALFAVGQRWLFRLLSMEMSDFQIGGGLLLFGLAITDLLATGRRTKRDHTGIGIVPLATPLIAGPALLTTIVLTVDAHGLAVTLLAVALNLVLTWILLRSADRLAARIGREVLNGFSKVLMVLLAGYGVMMVRQGILAFLREASFRVVPAAGGA